MIPLALPTQKLEVKYDPATAWRVVLPMKVYSELMHYVDKFNGECSGAALVDMTVNEKEQVFTLDRVFLPAEQHNTAATTDIESEAVGKLVTQLVREGVDTARLRCHWHSHASMSVFHSGTDEDNYKVLKTGDWLVSLVLNKAGEVKASVHYYRPFAIEALNVPVTVQLEEVVIDPSWDRAYEAVQAYEKARLPVTVYGGGKRGKHTAAQETGYETSYTERWKDRGEMSKAALNMLLNTSDAFLAMSLTAVRWDEAEVTVLNTLTNRVHRLSLQLEDLREATQEDLVDAYEFAGGMTHD